MFSGQKPIEAAMHDDDRDALAAEYVLGTLSAEERDQAEALLAKDAGFARTARLWGPRRGEASLHTVPDFLSDRGQISEDSKTADLASTLLPSGSATEFDNQLPRS